MASKYMEDAPRSMREIVQKKFLDEVVNVSGIFGDPNIYIRIL